MKGAELVSRFLRYGTVGVLVNFSGYGLFLFLLFAGLPPVPATGITYVVMVLTSYLVNRNWTFRSQRSHASDVPRYLLAYGIGLVVAMGAMYLLSDLLNPALAQVFVIVLAALVIYASLELVRFGRLEKGNGD